MKSLYDIRLMDSIFEPGSYSKKAFFKKTDRHTFYKVHCYLEGPDIAYVEKVNYILHESFAKPECLVLRSSSNSNCVHTLWVWGLFILKAKVYTRTGHEISMSKMLDYDRDFQHPGIQWIRKA